MVAVVAVIAVLVLVVLAAVGARARRRRPAPGTPAPQAPVGRTGPVVVSELGAALDRLGGATPRHSAGSPSSGAPGSLLGRALDAATGDDRDAPKP